MRPGVFYPPGPLATEDVSAAIAVLTAAQRGGIIADATAQWLGGVSGEAIRTLEDKLTDLMTGADWSAGAHTLVIGTLRVRAGTKEGQISVCSGRSSRLDGGGGLFMWDGTSTTADNGITCFQATGTAVGRWKRVFDGKINAKWGGVIGDAVTDDTVNAQAVVDYVAGIGGGIIYFPHGTYVINGLVLKSNVRLEGAVGIAGMGHVSAAVPGATIFKGTLAGFVVDTLASPRQSGIGVTGIVFKGAGAGTAIGGVRFQDVSRCFVANCGFDNFADEAIKWVAGAIATFQWCFAQNCLLARDRSDVSGVVDMGGTDGVIMGGDFTPSIVTSLPTATVTGTAQGGAAGYLTAAAGAVGVDNKFRGWLCTITGGTGAGQRRRIASSTAADDHLVPAQNWGTAPNATSTYRLDDVRCAAIVIRAANNWVGFCQPEIAAVGVWVLPSTPGVNKLVSVRADIHLGPSFILETDVQITGSHAFRAGLHANAIFPGFLNLVPTNGNWSGCTSGGLGSDTNKMLYGFEDQAASDTSKLHCAGWQVGTLASGGKPVYVHWNTGGYFDTPGSTFKSFVDADTTPSVSGYRCWRTANTGATSITTFDDGFEGQIIEILCDTNTTFVNGSTLKTTTGANKSPGANRIVMFRYRGGVWIEIGG